jgi:hypothetical protein
MKLTIQLKLERQYLDLKYYQIKFMWQDDSDWIPDTIKLSKDGCVTTLSFYDIARHIIKLAQEAEVESIKFRIFKDDQLKHNLKVLTKQQDGIQGLAAKSLCSSAKEQANLLSFFRSNLDLEVVN